MSTAFRCARCDLRFEAEQARCPKCLRKTTVEPADGRSAPASADAAARVERRGMASDPAAGRSGLAAFGLRWLGGALLFSFASLMVRGLEHVPLGVRLAATALGATLLALAWTAVAAVARAARAEREQEADDEDDDDDAQDG